MKGPDQEVDGGHALSSLGRWQRGYFRFGSA